MPDRMPMFQRLFCSTSPHHKTERAWALRLLAQGMRTAEDFEICWRRRIFHLCTGFYGSPAAELSARAIIRQLFLQAVRLPSAAEKLCRYGVWEGTQ